MSEMRKQHYNFAFFGIPLLALSNTDEFYKKIDHNDRTEYIKSLWNGLGRKTGDKIPDSGINCSKFKYEEDCELFIIQLPKPQFQPEAFYIGLIFTIESKLLSKKAISARCFTLELSYDFSSRNEVYVVGEMKKGYPFPNFDHTNFGMIEKNDTSSFINAINDVVVGRKTTSSWIN